MACLETATIIAVFPGENDIPTETYYKIKQLNERKGFNAVWIIYPNDDSYSQLRKLFAVKEFPTCVLLKTTGGVFLGKTRVIERSTDFGDVFKWNKEYNIKGGIIYMN